MERGVIHGASVYAVVPMTGCLKKKHTKNTKNSNFAKTKITTTAIIVLVEFIFDQHNEHQRSITKHSRTKRNASIRSQYTSHITAYNKLRLYGRVDQQVLSHNSTERPTATYASTVHQQVMSQNTTTLPNSNVQVGKKKIEKIPDEQGLCGKKISCGSQEKTSDEQELHNSGGKSESGGKNRRAGSPV